MRNFFNYFVLVILFNIGFVINANSSTINARSCSREDVQSAINSANDGDIVNIPAGTCVWTSAYEATLNKRIIIKGAGIDQTIIVDEVPKTGWRDMPFWITSMAGKPFRITGISFRGGTVPNGLNANIHIFGTCKSWRIDHCKFEHPRGRAIQIRGYNYGLIDHCEFILDDQQGVFIDHRSWGGYSWGDGSWYEPLYLGTEKAVYLEDNIFTKSVASGGILDACYGARFVFRYNTVNNSFIASHGTESTGRGRSLRSYEIYENTFNYTLEGPWFTAFFNRGGTGVMFSNTLKGEYDSLCRLATYREFHDFDPWGTCDGTSPFDLNDINDSGNAKIYDSGTHTGINGTGVLTCDGKTWDANQWVGYSLHNITKSKSSIIIANTENTISVKADLYAGSLTWNTGESFRILKASICLDQVGRSTGNLIMGDLPNPDEWPQQALEPFYEWNNTLNEGDGDIHSISSHLVEGRDYYNDTQRPGYSPYIYPHPLTGPFPPSNLRIKE